MKFSVLLAASLFLVSCNSQPSEEDKALRNLRVIDADQEEIPESYIQVLGIAQDAGIPQIACKKICCTHRKHEKVSSIGIVDAKHESTYLFDATPDIIQQWAILDSAASEENSVEAIFLTHAHIGHYTGVMYLGKEAMGAEGISVFTMPRMKLYLESNGPWSQLVENKNISLHNLDTAKTVLLGNQLKVEPILVPHRDEFSETVGFYIQGPSASALFIPDIDKWGKWNQNIIDWIRKVDYALLDGTFYDDGELENRDMSEIPHPFIVESMALFNVLSEENKAKVYFTHFNHTNPVLFDPSIREEVEERGFHIAQEGLILPL